ncbi:MAG TPA: hypothetical protein VMN99_00045, partial [Anaerolineales bacterium]|nr:hypothetical protein [Anaerolineales bacterium]
MRRILGYFLGFLLIVVGFGCSPKPVITVENASSLRLEKIIGAGKVNDIAWSPDGTVIAVIQDFDISFYDAVSLQLIGNAGVGGTEAVFSPDGNTISIIGESEVIIWDLTKKETTWAFPFEDVFAKQLAYNNKGSRLAFWGIYIYDAVAIHVLEVWDVNTGEQVYFEEETGADLQVEFSPNDTLLAVRANGRLKFIALETG